MKTMMEAKILKDNKDHLGIQQQPLVLAPDEDTYEKLSKSELPNFTSISVPDKRLINKSRLNMMLLLRPFDKAMAKLHFTLIMKWEDEKQKILDEAGKKYD